MNPVAERIARAMKPTPSMKGREGECTEPSAAEIVRLSGVKGLTEEDVRTGKNPDEIAQIWLSRMLNAKSDRARMEQEEREAEQKRFPLLPYSQLVYNMEQQMPGVYTFAFAFSYDINKIDTARLNEAIATAIANHPVFRGNEQYYHLEAIAPIVSISPKGFLHIRLNRILGDGYSFGLLLEDICKAYKGIPLEPDYYFRYLQQIENHKHSREYAEHEAELRERYGAVDGITIPVRPTLDKEIEDGDEWLAGEYVLP